MVESGHTPNQESQKEQGATGEANTPTPEDGHATAPTTQTQPTAQSAASTTPKDEPIDEFEKLKKKFLRSKLVAIGLLIVLIITNLKELADIWNYFFPYKAMVVTANPEHTEVGIYKSVTLKLNVAVNGEKDFLFNDAVAYLRFLVKKGGKYVNAKPEDIFLGTYQQRLPAFDNSSNKADISFSLRSVEVGEYIVIAEVSSKESRLHAQDSFFVDVTEYDLDELNTSNGSSRVYVIKDSILDVSPRFINELNEIKILVWPEAQATDVLKSTVWISPDYIGAMGGAGYSVYRDVSTIADLYSGLSKDSYDKLKDTVQNRHLEQMGFIPTVFDGACTLPVGDNFYAVKMLDSRRLLFTKLDPKADTLLAGKWIDSHDNPVKEWELAEYKLKFKTEFSAGATGRNFVYSLYWGPKTYEYIEHNEASPTPIESDFPVYLHMNSSLDSKEFLKIIFNESDSLYIIRYKDI